jgi:hypothetical protein
MTTSPPPDAFLNIVFLADIDLQKAYLVGKEIATKKNIPFNGIIPYILPTNPPLFAQSLSFIITSVDANILVDEVIKKLEISRASIRIALNPVPKAPEMQPIKTPLSYE